MTFDLIVVFSFCCLAIASTSEGDVTVSFSLNDLQDDPERNALGSELRRTTEDIVVEEESELEATEDESELEDLLAEAEEGTQQTEKPEVSRCCTREKKIRAVGFGINGEIHYVDVGHCRRTCKFPHLTHNTHQIQKSSLKKPSGRHLLVPEHSSSRSCISGHHCEPVVLRQETHHLLSGPVTLSTVSSCSCLPRKVRCQRLSQRLTLFPDSPYESDVDVGVCRGRCVLGEEACRPSRNRTISVDGPNGAVCINIIDECSCKGSCYRMHNTEVYYDWTWSDLTNSTQQRIKEIDVGQCVGVCAPGGLNRCLLRDPNNTTICKMSLNQRPASCGPKSFQTHRLTNAHGLERVVLAITGCGCM